MRRSLVLLVATLLTASLVAPTVGAQTSMPEPDEPCGPTTIDATLQLAADGTLECGPGQAVVVREELATAEVGRADSRESLASFFAIADVQLADEESPTRGEGADPCYPSPGISSSAFRPHETMVPHLMNAHIRAANQIAAGGSPNLGDDFDFLVGLGDLADNQQYNEIRWIIDILDGGKLVNPDTGDDPVLGGEGYDGPQTDEPVGAGDRTAQDVSSDLPSGGVLELANEPFWVTGIRESNDHGAEQLPWYSLPGNHDVKVQGTLPDELSGTDHNEMKAWRAIYRSYYIGNAKAVLQDISPERKQKLCEAFEAQDEELFTAAMTEILSDPEGSSHGKVIPSDQARMPLYRTDEIKQIGDEEACVAVATGRPLAQEICRSSWVEEHFDTTGIPVGHGYQEDENTHRCDDEDGAFLARACYAFTDGPFLYIGLDSNPPEGAETGNIDPEQVEWLERELIASSSMYFDASGAEVANPAGEDRMIVVFAHHPSDSMSNEFAPTSPGIEGAEFRELLLRFPNVILNANGHTHQNRIWARSDESLGTGYWEVNTSAIADYPTQSRTIEIADNNDGTLSIFATVFDALVGPDAGDISWADHDPTSETELSEGAVTRDINEDWLASWGREVMFYDPQGSLSKLGSPEDRNVELLLEMPAWFAAADPEPTESSSVSPTPTMTESAHATESPTPAETSDNGPSGSGSGSSGGSGTGSGSGGEASAVPGAERGSITTTIAADRSTSKAGGDVTLTGVVSVARTCGTVSTVAISARPHGSSSFTEVGRADVSSDGAWSKTITARRSSAYIARAAVTDRCDGLASTPVDVLVRAAVGLSPRRCRATHQVNGLVQPANAGDEVVLKRRRGARWRSVASSTIDDDGRFELYLQRCSGKYRVRGPLDSMAARPGVARFAL